MNMNAKPVAKSLHTVSVLVNLSKYFMEHEREGAEGALASTMHILGLAGREDPYDLAGQALKQLLAFTPKA